MLWWQIIYLEGVYNLKALCQRFWYCTSAGIKLLGVTELSKKMFLQNNNKNQNPNKPNKKAEKYTLLLSEVLLLNMILQVSVGGKGKIWICYNTNIFTEKPCTKPTACSCGYLQASILRGMRVIRKLCGAICMQERPFSSMMLLLRKSLLISGLVHALKRVLPQVRIRWGKSCASREGVQRRCSESDMGIAVYFKLGYALYII